MAVWGVFIGVLLGIIIAIVCIKAYNTNNKIKTDYDERQEAVRGRGYKYAAYTAWVLLGLVVCIKIADVNIRIEDAMIAFSILAISALVQTIHAIMHDAYFGSNNDRRKYIILFIIFAIINLANAISRFSAGEMIVDGTLTWAGISGICGLMFVILVIALGVKNLISKREEEDE